MPEGGHDLTTGLLLVLLHGHRGGRQLNVHEVRVGGSRGIVDTRERRGQLAEELLDVEVTL